MISTILLIAVTAGFASYVYYNPPKRSQSNSSNQNTICMDYSGEPLNTLNVDLVHAMTNGYRQNQLRFIKTVMQEDAHSIWFDLETLKKFLYQVEKNTDSSAREERSLGIRIYYSRYPNNGTWEKKYPDLRDLARSELTKKFEEHHTLVMVPTIQNGKTHIDFHPLDVRTYGEKMSEFSEYQSTNTVTSIFALTSTKRSSASGNISAQNHGSLIPPADGSGESF